MISKRIVTCTLLIFILGLLNLNYAQAASRCQSPDECSMDEPDGQNALFSSGEYPHLVFYPPPAWGVWIEVDPGYGTAFRYGGPAGNVGVNVRYRHNLFILQYTTVQQSTSDINAGVFFGDGSPDDGGFVRNLSLMYNWIVDRKWGFFSYGAGVSYVRGREEDDEIRIPDPPPPGMTRTIDIVQSTETAFGIPFQAQVMWLPFGNYFGLGLKVFVNANFKKDFTDAGAVLVIGIGKFR